MEENESCLELLLRKKWCEHVHAFDMIPLLSEWASSSREPRNWP